MSLGLKGSPSNSIHPRNSGPRARLREFGNEGTATDDDDVDPLMIIVWSRHSARVLK